MRCHHRRHQAQGRHVPEVHEARANLTLPRESRAHCAQSALVLGSCHSRPRNRDGNDCRTRLSTMSLNACGLQFLRGGKSLSHTKAASCVPLSVLPESFSRFMALCIISNNERHRLGSTKNVRGARDVRGEDRFQKAKASFCATQGVHRWLCECRRCT